MGRILSDRNLSKIWVGFLLVLAAILIVVYYIDSTPPPGSTRISARDGMVQVYVPAGPFLMGLKKETAAADCLRYERECDAINFAGAEPEHNITLT
ncbi:MAG: hypothetical protein LWX83_03420, partial [Anaerolineae bacterium]|nr:hypothetical protein [Anaerolineae bacterium]